MALINGLVRNWNLSRCQKSPIKGFHRNLGVGVYCLFKEMFSGFKSHEESKEATLSGN